MMPLFWLHWLHAPSLVSIGQSKLKLLSGNWISIFSNSQVAKNTHTFLGLSFPGKCKHIGNCNMTTNITKHTCTIKPTIFISAKGDDAGAVVVDEGRFTVVRATHVQLLVGPRVVAGLVQQTEQAPAHTTNIHSEHRLFYNTKQMKGKALRKHSLHEKTAPSVLLKPFINNNNTTI